jgi:hypothetical protein
VILQSFCFKYSKKNMETLMKSHLKPMIGIGICGLSSLLMCSSFALCKYLKVISPVTLTCARFLYIWLLAQPVSLHRYETESPFPKGKRLWLFLRGLIGSANNVLNLWAYQVRIMYNSQNMESNVAIICPIYKMSFNSSVINIVTNYFVIN